MRAGKIFGKICIKSIKIRLNFLNCFFCPFMQSVLRRGTQKLGFLVGAESNRRGKFKLLAMQEKSAEID